MILAVLAGTACAITRPAACRDTNQLAMQPGFEAAVASFLPRRSADYLYVGPLAGQAVQVLGGPPDDSARIGALYRFTACRAHSCTEKGALVLRPDGRIVAIGILHSTCAVPGHTSRCTDDTILTLFVRGKHPAVVANLTGWAREAAARSYHLSGTPAPRLTRVEVRPAGD